METLTATEIEVIKKRRGRPRKEKIETETTDPLKKEVDLKRKLIYRE